MNKILKVQETKMDAPTMTEILDELGLLDEVDKFDVDSMFVVKIIELLGSLDRKLLQLYFLTEIYKEKEEYTLEDMMLELKKFYYGNTHVEKHFNK